jgi:hypothetical protein
MAGLALFGHVLGASLLISAVVITVGGLLRAHRATTSQQIRAAMGGVPVADRLMPLAMVLVLGFGLYLVAVRDHHPGTVHWSSAWVIVSLIVFAVMSVLGPAVEARRAARVHVAACAAPDGPIDIELDRLRRDPLHAHVTLFGAAQLLALLYLMTNRPGVTATLVAVAVATLGSIVVTRLTLSRIPAVLVDTPNHPLPTAVEGAA